MIEDARISSEVAMAMENLNAIGYVFERDGFISPKYLKEKVDNAEAILKWLKAINPIESE